MLLRKQGFPEEDELVLCTVTSVQYHSVFVNLDEYNKKGLIHISEISPGRIRNIRDFVKEGKKIVCKVLRVDKEKGHIDLSLRRVNASEKKSKIEEIKKEQNAEKIVETVAKKLKIDIAQFYSQISSKILKKYDNLNVCFDDIVKSAVSLEQLEIQKKYAQPLEDSIRQRIKLPEVKVIAKVRISTYAPDGVDIIKHALEKAESLYKDNITITYMGSGNYRFVIKAEQYKEAEKILKESSEKVIDTIGKNEGFVEVVKEKT